MVLSLKITSCKNIINYRIGCYAKHSRMVTNSPRNKNFQWFEAGNGKTPEKQMSDYAFREKKSERLSFCRTDLMNY